MRHKILVLGTSNSILRGGWVEGFSQALPNGTVVENMSIGGSPGSQFAAWCDRDLSGYECVIFDSIVNDENMMDRGLIGDTAFYENLIFQILSTISSQTSLVVLGFCNERYAKVRSNVYKFQREATERVGGRFVSVIDFALQVAEPRFRDGAHISILISNSFGRALAKDFLSSLSGPSPVEYFGGNFSTVRVSSLCDADTIHRKNNLVSESFSVLKEGEAFDIPEAGNLIGMKLDSCNTYGFVKLTDREGRNVIQSLRFPHYDSKFLIYFTAVENGFPSIRLEVLGYSDSFKPSAHEKISKPAPDCRVAISTLTFWRGDRAPA